jgi:MerR family transcriptional regulator, redox-sensitive transcriptional activator SoxR
VLPSEITIGELSQRSGVSESALRFYERQGLIAAQRTGGNQRLYARDVVRRVALVQAGKAAGIPLGRMRAALARLPDGRTPRKRDWEELSRSWRRDLDKRIATLEAIRSRLTTCIGCGCLSLQRCGLINHSDEAAQLGAGAHFLRTPSPRER